MDSSALPPNIHVSTHPCLQVKLSQLRSSSTNARETKTLVHEISLIVGCEATANLNVVQGPIDQSHMGYQFITCAISPTSISIIPVLRSGLGMLDALQTLLPISCPVHHLGLFREASTLSPVEYYNNLPYHRPDANMPSSSPNTSASEIAIIVDPVIATGGTAVAAIQTLREWGVKRIILVAILGAMEGILKASNEWPEGVEIYVAGLDKEVDSRGMINPGLGDIGDRLFLTVGK